MRNIKYSAVVSLYVHSQKYIYWFFLLSNLPVSDKFTITIFFNPSKLLTKVYWNFAVFYRIHVVNFNYLQRAKVSVIHQRSCEKVRKSTSPSEHYMFFSDRKIGLKPFLFRCWLATTTFRRAAVARVNSYAQSTVTLFAENFNFFFCFPIYFSFCVMCLLADRFIISLFFSLQV